MNLVNNQYQKKARQLLKSSPGEDTVAKALPFPEGIELAALIDHTLLAPDASISAVNKLCKEAMQFRFATVCVNPVHVERCVALLGDDIPVATVVAYPLGANHTRIKVAETGLAVEQGAREIDVVMNIGLLKTANFQEVFQDINAVRQACPEAELKVILETGLLTPEQMIIGALLCREAGVDYVSTSTGFSSRGATAKDVSLLRYVVGDDLGVKASGNLRTLDELKTMVQAGATRLSLNLPDPPQTLAGLLGLT